MSRWACLLQVLLLLASVDASRLYVPRGKRAGLAVVSFETSRETNSNSILWRHKQPGNAHLSVGLDNGLEAAMNRYARYYANLTVGTPPQTVRVHLDTGSNDLVLNTPKSLFCIQNPGLCAGATYDASLSSTYHYLSSNASLGYGGGDRASGDYVKETMSFNGVTLKDVQMVISSTTTSRDSIWGLSYGTGEQGIYNGQPRYPTIAELMVSTGAINSDAYSLHLNSLSSLTGSLLFGGLDRAKFHGPLYTIPVEPNPGYTSTTQWIVTVTGISLTLATSSHAKTTPPRTIPLVANRADPYLLDSGTYNTQLPLELLNPIFAALGAEYDSPSNYAMVPCSLASNASTLDFIFTSFAIAIPLSELIFPRALLSYDSYAPTLSDGRTPACLLGLSPGGQDFILGDTFMRSAYIVFDGANDEVSLAQANIGAAVTRHDIVEIGRGKNAVPGATRVKDPTRAWANETAIANYVIPATGTWPFYAEVTQTVSATTPPPLVVETTAGVGPVPTKMGGVTAAGASATAVGAGGSVRVGNGWGLVGWGVVWGVWLVV